MFNNFVTKIKAVILILFSIMVGIELYFPLARVFFKVPINYNDGWNAYRIAQTLAGQPLYQNILTPITYPPFSFYIVAFLVKIFGNPLATERLISIFSILVIGFCVFYLVKFFTKTFFESIFAALFCIQLFTTFANAYVGMADFQLLGNALMLIGMIIYFKFTSLKSLFITVLLISVSFFIKLNLITIPIVLVLYSFFYRKKQFLPLICFLFINILAFTVISQIVSNNHFIYWALSLRNYFLIHAFYLSFTVLIMLVIPIICSLIFSFISIKENKYHFFILYFITSLITGVIFSGGGGININVFFDLFISISCVIGLFMYRLLILPKSSLNKRVIYLYVITILLLFIMFNFARNNYFFLEELKSEEKISLSDVSFVKNHKGNALCETIVLCYFAGKPFVFEPYGANLLVEKKLLKEADLTNLLKEKKFSVIQLEPMSYYHRSLLIPGEERFSNNFISKLNTYYHISYRSELGIYFVPK